MYDRDLTSFSIAHSIAHYLKVTIFIRYLIKIAKFISKIAKMYPLNIDTCTVEGRQWICKPVNHALICIYKRSERVKRACSLYLLNFIPAKNSDLKVLPVISHRGGSRISGKMFLKYEGTCSVPKFFGPRSLQVELWYGNFSSQHALQSRKLERENSL